MAEYKSKHARLGFYVDDKLRTFASGRYVTEDTEEIKVLDNLSEVWRVDAPKGAPAKTQQTEAKPAPKAAPTRKPSAK